MVERIYIGFSVASGVPHTGETLGYHKTLYYQDSAGKIWAIEWFPKEKITSTQEKARKFLYEEIVSSGEENTDSPFGRLQVVARPANEKDIGRPIKDLVFSDDLSAMWERMAIIYLIEHGVGDIV
jgi:hypothetical protein